MWRRTLFVMAAIQGITTLSVSLSWPFLPLYLGQLGVHPAPTASMWAGFIAAPQFLLAAICAPFWGALADRIGRKPMVLRCSISMAIFTVLMGLAQNEWQLLALSVLYGIFSGFVGAATALVGTQVPEERLGYALGWMSTAQLAGALLGPLLGGLLADALHDFRRIYFLTSLGGIVAVLLTVFLIREVRGAIPKAKRPEASLKSIFQVRELGPMFLVLVLSNVCAGAVSPVVAPYVRGLLGPDAPFATTMAGAAIAVTGIAGLASAPLLGRRADRLGYRKILLISILGAALFTLPQALGGSIWIFLLLRSGVGVFLGGTTPTANAWIGRRYPRDDRGRIFGISASAGSLGYFLGPLIGGLVAARFGIPAVFIVVAALMFGNFAWIAIATRGIPETAS